MGKLHYTTFDNRKSFAEARAIYDSAKGEGAFGKLSRADKITVLTTFMPKRGELYINNWLTANYPTEPEQEPKEISPIDGKQ